jgi:hypothetical protein
VAPTVAALFDRRIASFTRRLDADERAVLRRAS